MKIVDVILGCAVAFLVMLMVGVVIRLSIDIIREMNAPEKFYTVKTPDAVYKDLIQRRSYGTWAIYTTVDGKTIKVNGTWTEIEQQ